MPCYIPCGCCVTVGSRVSACSGITCHLHFWQIDRGLLRATAVTRSGMDTKYESVQKVNSGAEIFLATPAGIRTGNLSIKSLALYQQAILAPVLRYQSGGLTDSCYLTPSQARSAHRGEAGAHQIITKFVALRGKIPHSHPLLCRVILYVKVLRSAYANFLVLCLVIINSKSAHQVWLPRDQWYRRYMIHKQSLTFEPALWSWPWKQHHFYTKRSSLWWG